MRPTLLLTCFILLAALPALAQEEAGPAGDGGMSVQVTPIGPDNVKAIKNTLAKAKISLSRDQENALKPFIEEAVKAMEELNATMAAARGGRGGMGSGTPRREAGAGMRGQGGPPMTMVNPEYTAKMRELNDAFEAKMKTVLRPDQAAAWDAYRKEEIKRAGGLEALKMILADAKTPLSPEQERQIGPLYTELFRARTMLTRQSQGNPDAAKLKELESNNALQVMKFLGPAQKKALLDSMRPATK